MSRRLLCGLGRHARSRTDQSTLQPALADSLNRRMEEIHEQCTECGACMRHCAFLQQHGSPLAIVRRTAPDAADQMGSAFGCSLCGLCTAVCPQRLDPCGLFLDMRRRRVALGAFDSSPYRPLLIYEALGRSQLLSWFSLPSGCTTLFFPGCSLPGTRPAVTLRIFQYLQTQIPALGIALTCCAKPSHDLGRNDCFSAHFRSIREQLHARGITSVLTACPNCTNIFRQYAPELTVQTVFTFFAERGVPTAPLGQGREISIHDPCSLRADHVSQTAIRSLLHRLGYTPVPMPHQQERTLCCGEGGAVGFVRPDFAQSWTRKRMAEVSGRLLVTSCAGCCAMFAPLTPVIHLADLLFPPRNQRVLPTVSRPPMTYLNRLWLKFQLRQQEL